MKGKNRLNAADIPAYEIVEQREIPDVDSIGILLRHRKTGAKVMLLSNDDDNKVFYIGFRTPPEDSTGVAHILEHSTLCGSKKYPLKDPFVELVKGSLNTFLNAMTYPDKTVYPVASCNDKDFRNLLGVYLDAVFYPNVYENESIFRQEGWHYEYDDEGKLFVNGVVYNEMKGALSSPDDILSREVMNSLYPDTCYGVESGGDPEFIPDLTYEQFLDFHRAYYHPSNSYIYLYGDMDMAETVSYIDREYLSAYDRREVDSAVKVQKPFDKPNVYTRKCPLGEGEDPDENTSFSINFALPAGPDIMTATAVDAIDYALLTVPGAPLKKALTEAGVGNEIYSTFESGILQPYYSIVAKGTTLDKKDEFLRIVKEVIEDRVKNGLDRKAIKASLASSEFSFREADYGRYPKGLMYGLSVLDSWLYDETKPFMLVEMLDVYKALNDKLSTSYYDDLLKKITLDNPHRSEVTILPDADEEKRREDLQRKKLDEFQKNLTPEEEKEIKDKFTALRAFQDRQDTEEELACLPQLLRGDLKKEAVRLQNEIGKIEDSLFVYHELPSRGIGYLKLIFKLDNMPGELFPYVGLLRDLWTNVDTSDMSYADINTELDLVSGGHNVTHTPIKPANDPEGGYMTLEVTAKYLYENIARVFELTKDFLFTTKTGDHSRILEALIEQKSQRQGVMLSSGHLVASSRAMACFDFLARINDEMGGLAYYRFLSDLIDNYDAKKDEMTAKLNETMNALLRPENLIIDYTGEKASVDTLTEQVKTFIHELPGVHEYKAQQYKPEPYEPGVGFMNSGRVQYVCRAGNFLKNGYEYTGALRVLKVFLGYQYLWMNVRVKGGAYGCMGGSSRTGNSYFVSYRDPNLAETIEIFENAAKEVAAFDADEREMTKLIIGAVGEIDTPMTVSAKGVYSYLNYMTGVTDDDLQKERDEMIGATPESIRALAEYIKAWMDDDILVVVGNGNKIKENEKLFNKIENLL